MIMLNEEYYKLSDLESAGSINENDLLEISSVSGDDIESKNISIEKLSEFFTTAEFQELQTESKTIIGALNELANR